MDKKWLGLIYVTLFSVSWAIQTIIDKYAMTKGIEPLTFSYQTLIVATIFMLLYILIKDYNQLKIKSKKPLLRMMWVGVTGSGLGTLAGFYGLKYSTAVNYGFLVKTTIIFSIALAFFFANEKISFKKIVYVIILIFGTYLVSTKGETIYPNLGDIIILASAFFFSLANIIAKPLLKEYSAEVVTLFRTLFGSLVILVFIPFIIPNFYHVENIGLIFLRAIFVFLTLLFLNKTIQATNISYMTMMSMMYSVFVAILGLAILGEIMTLIQFIGGIIIVVFAVMIQKSDIHKT